jgi:O-antigen/teichoic acid export membrane protein
MALTVNVALNLALIPSWGLVGTGIASSIAYVLLAGSYLLWLYRAANLDMRDFQPRIITLLRR